MVGGPGVLGMAAAFDRPTLYVVGRLLFALGRNPSRRLEGYA